MMGNRFSRWLMPEVYKSLRARNRAVAAEHTDDKLDHLLPSDFPCEHALLEPKISARDGRC